MYIANDIARKAFTFFINEKNEKMVYQYFMISVAIILTPSILFIMACLIIPVMYKANMAIVVNNKESILNAGFYLYNHRYITTFLLTISLILYVFFMVSRIVCLVKNKIELNRLCHLSYYVVPKDIFFENEVTLYPGQMIYEIHFGSIKGFKSIKKEIKDYEHKMLLFRKAELEGILKIIEMIHNSEKGIVSDTIFMATSHIFSDSTVRLLEGNKTKDKLHVNVLRQISSYLYILLTIKLGLPKRAVKKEELKFSKISNIKRFIVKADTLIRKKQFLQDRLEKVNSYIERHTTGQ